MRTKLFLAMLACATSLGAVDIRLGTVSVGAFYSRYSGSFSCGPFGYRPLFWNAFGPYCPPFYDFYSPLVYFQAGPHMGEVKLSTAGKKAEVFLDGAYAGTAERLRTFWLEPGAYNLEVQDANRAPFSRRIYVLSGKTLKIDARSGGKP